MIFSLSLILFLVWLPLTIDVIYGCLFRIKKLKKIGQAKNQPSPFFPRVSIIFSARNEARNLEVSLKSLLSQDYPDYEVIAVNDRSTDQTFQLMQSFVASPRKQGSLDSTRNSPVKAVDARGLKILDIAGLPSGWLGKNHGLYQGYKKSSGEWLLFTDADVGFSPETLSLAMEEAMQQNADHLVLTPRLHAEGWTARLFIHYFIFCFLRNFRLWACSDPRSSAYAGMGAFNLIKRDAYEKIGTHEGLRLEVVDDMELGHAIKKAGFKQRILSAQDFLRVEWFQGKKGFFSVLEKNGFAGARFNLSAAVVITLMAMTVDILPFVLIFLARDAAFGLSLATLILIFLSWGAAHHEDKTMITTLPALPLGCALFLAAFWNSVFKTLGQGGIRWRETFYSVDELKGREKNLRAWV